jgi:iron complex outermembrane receptor protein
MPTLRIGLFAVYNFNPKWLASLGVRYSSDSFGDLANTDTATNVFGAIDAYLFLDAKVSYRLPTGGRFSFGVDNLTNETAFVYHPWPQRTFFAEFVLDVGHDLLRAGP